MTLRALDDIRIVDEREILPHELHIQLETFRNRKVLGVPGRRPNPDSPGQKRFRDHREVLFVFSQVAFSCDQVLLVPTCSKAYHSSDSAPENREEISFQVSHRETPRGNAAMRDQLSGPGGRYRWKRMHSARRLSTQRLRYSEPRFCSTVAGRSSPSFFIPPMPNVTRATPRR